MCFEITFLSIYMRLLFRIALLHDGEIETIIPYHSKNSIASSLNSCDILSHDLNLRRLSIKSKQP